MSENWKPAVGYEGLYEVSDLGRVRSLPGGRRHGKVLRLLTTTWGYHVVFLCRDKKVRQMKVARLVLEAFVSPRPLGMHCLHFDGNKTHDRPHNLRWGTDADNGRDRARLGEIHQPGGADSHAAKLTEESVAAIRRRAAHGDKQRTIASAFGISVGQVSKIVTRRQWTQAP